MVCFHNFRRRFFQSKIVSVNTFFMRPPMTVVIKIRYHILSSFCKIKLFCLLLFEAISNDFEPGYGFRDTEIYSGHISVILADKSLVFYHILLKWFI